MLTYLLLGLSLGFPAAVQPGPFQAYLLLQVTRQGWRRTLPAALAPLISDGPIIVLMMLVLTALPAAALSLIKVIGGMFILHLAWRAVGSFRRPVLAIAASSPEQVFANQSVWQAALINALNPNPYIFWGTVGGPTLLAAWQEAVGQAVAFILGMYGTLVGGMAILIYFFGTIGTLSTRANRILAALSAVALVAFGCWQLWQGGAELVQLTDS